MSTTTPFSPRIFVVDGDPDGLCLVKRSNWIVKAGSQAAGETVPSMQQHVRGMYDLRLELISNGVLQNDNGNYRFTQDYAFKSPSTAAAVVLGRSANGRIEWKNAGGKTLKELQEREAGESST